jgi:penicillin-binding protein 2
VVEAIQESCNCFFYEVGRQLTIDKMNEYCRLYGLGEPTGIELPESVGILAGPDYRNDNGLDKWSPGDTLQAAIGQSDNLFTPLQITSYISTVLNGGTRYAAHLLHEVRSYEGEVTLESNTKIMDSFTIPDNILSVVKEGMKGVMDNGSAASVFRGYEIPVGGKTGTAQVSDTKSDNAIITAFAPFDDPEICVTCIIEQGSGGTDAGYAVRDVFDYYFGVGKYSADAEVDAIS